MPPPAEPTDGETAVMPICCSKKRLPESSPNAGTLIVTLTLPGGAFGAVHSTVVSESVTPSHATEPIITTGVALG